MTIDSHTGTPAWISSATITVANPAMAPTLKVDAGGDDDEGFT